MFYTDDTGTRMLNLQLIAEGTCRSRLPGRSPFRYRWAFIDDDIDAVREKNCVCGTSREACPHFHQHPIIASQFLGHRSRNDNAKIHRKDIAKPNGNLSLCFHYFMQRALGFTGFLDVCAGIFGLMYFWNIAP